MTTHAPVPATRGAAALRLLRELRHRFSEGRAAVGDARWRAWLRTCAIGAAGMIVLMLVLRYGAERALDRGWFDWESRFLLALGDSGTFGFSDAVFFQTFGSDITLIILIGATAGIAAWMRRPIITLSIILAALVPDLIGRFGWAIWSRARPDLLYDGIASPGFHSFPSGHTSKTTAVYGLLIVLWLRASGSAVEKLIAAVLLLLIVTVVPLGRMAMGVHWPTDVIAGFLIGAIWLAVLARALARADVSPPPRGHR